ncbi:MAG TPA: hypothetical protein VES40_09760, partial [Ilumatobacteraceae bacterium]|nr:hypothetical protein [Ilumatobacteraceae bacterium]
LDPTVTDPTVTDPTVTAPTVTDPTVTDPSVTVRIDDRSTEVMVDGATFTVPIGPLTLFEGPLEQADPPSPAHLTNALGLVADHLDDIIIAAPSFAAAASVSAVGPHVEAMARVEIGDSQIPAGYRLRRSDADEVFRTLATEPVVDRRHNPGLDDGYVESIIATCCMILGVMRRLDLDSIGVTAENSRDARNSDRQEST